MDPTGYVNVYANMYIPAIINEIKAMNLENIDGYMGDFGGREENELYN